jgi:membrane peptidoglycan carboxypeptidase
VSGLAGVAGMAPRPKQIFIGLLTAVLIVGVAVGVAYARTSIPSPSSIATAQTTTLYYSDGKTVLARIGTTTRTDVPLTAVPVHVRNAVLAAEDRQFYSEPGISPTGIMRAMYEDVKGGDVAQGGSTITQQYAKNAYLTQQRTFTRKFKEIFIATKLGQSRSKNAIFADYLNTIYFGRDAYGIQAAAKAYFNVGVGQLNVSQGALLAAVINAPSFYDPHINKAAAKSRWHYVVSGMVSQRWLTAAQAAKLHFPKTQPTKTGATCGLTTKRFICNAVESELTKSDGLTDAQFQQGGLKVVTTIDRKAQDAAVSAEQDLSGEDHGNPESSLVSIKPGDGAIEAMYAGQSYCDPKNKRDGCQDLSGLTSNFPYARPPGSSMKPYTLIAALKQGISINSVYPGPSHIDFPGTGGVGISNSGGESCSQPCTLIKALAQSINTVFVPLAQQVGPAAVAKVAHDSGISTTYKLATTPEITLGTEPVSVLDQADGYATIAAGGMHASPYLVQSVKSAQGQTIYAAKPKPNRVYSAAIASDAAYAMTKVLDCSSGGTACGKALSGRPAAGKTGTTSSNDDAWFIGYTPQLSTAVWLGNSNRHKPVVSNGSEVFGGDIPARIWQQMMTGALTGRPVLQFPTPATVGTIQNSAKPTPTKTTSPTASATPTKTATPTPTVTPIQTPTQTPTPSQPPPLPSTSITPTLPASPPASNGPGGAPGGQTRRTPS